jgi:prepilin-type N-terminal cleavage/methylation domain-containing protein
MRNSGVTLVELLVVIAVASILAVALGASFVGWQEGYSIEGETKDLYSDLMDTRLSALQRNREHYVVLETDQYTVYEDDDPPPDGDGVLDTADDREVLLEELPYEKEIEWNGDNQIDFTARGLSNDNKTICMFSEAEPDYDCIVVFVTRTKMGKIIDQGDDCNADNCELK